MRMNVPPRRLDHCLAVSEMAAELAELYGADVEKARFAGRYHDIAKAFSAEQSNRLLREYGLSEEYYNYPALAHSKLGEALLREEFGVADSEILSAVSNHTTGAAGMTLLDEIIFVADAVDATRSYGDVEYYRQLARTDIDRACLEIMDFNIMSISNDADKHLDTETLGARAYIENKISSKEG